MPFSKPTATRWRASLGLGWALATLLVQTVGAQVCHPPAGSHEARLLAFYSAPIVFAPAAPPESLPVGGVTVSGDATFIPDVDTAIATPQVCYAAKSENTKLSPIFPRPRVTVGLPFGIAVEASYLPPVTVGGATPNLGSVAVMHVHPIGGLVNTAVRAHATVGTVRGSITCPRDHLQSSPLLPCYGTQPSHDTFSPTSVGADVSVGRSAIARRLEAYGGAGVVALHPRFRVGFTDAAGGTDTTRIEVNLVRLAAFAGAAWRLVPGLLVSAQLYSVPADMTTVRIAASYVLR